MMSNDVLRSVRYILNINDEKMAAITALAGAPVAAKDITRMLKNEDDPMFLFCEDKIMAQFLDGLIYFKRGKDESKPPMPFELPITNNTVLKKLRVAFELKDDDILDLLKSSDYRISRSELGAFMRKKDHENYRPLGDQVLRYFLKGLTAKLRGVKNDKPVSKPKT